MITLEHIEYHGVPATRVTYTSDIPGDHISHVCMSVYIDGCSTCDKEKASGSVFFPQHFGSALCESGKKPHCTCDWCF